MRNGPPGRAAAPPRRSRARVLRVSVCGVAARSEASEGRARSDPGPARGAVAHLSTEGHSHGSQPARAHVTLVTLERVVRAPNETGARRGPRPEAAQPQ